MQKIFKKNIIIIMTTSILLISVCNAVLTMFSITTQQKKTFDTKIEQIIRTVEKNQEELADIKQDLSQDYLMRAKTAAFMISQNPDMVWDTKKLQSLVRLLNIDELHIADQNGILIHSSMPKYIGLDFHNGKQMQGFLSILENPRKDSFVIQPAMPNSAEGKIMKYVGVSRLDEPGIVQIGLSPVRQLEAQKQNTYDFIFSQFPTDTDEEFFAIHCPTNTLIGHSEGMSDESFEENFDLVAAFSDCEESGIRRINQSDVRFVVSRKYKNILICASIPIANLLVQLLKNTILMLLYLFSVELLVIFMLNRLLREKVVKGIHEILRELSYITHGNLTATVHVGGNPEFEELSDGINTMVKNIISSADRVGKIVDLSGLPLAAFEYNSEMDQIFITSRLGELLQIPPDEMEYLHEHFPLFRERLEKITETPIPNETDIFEITEHQFVRIHLSTEAGAYTGVVTNVTSDVLAKQRIHYEANHDQLTGLARYRYFKELATEKLKHLGKDQFCAAVMIDLDSFKKINDTYGHDVGDLYLQSFAAMLQKLPKDTCLTARRSGDEFCFFAYNYISEEEILALLQGFWSLLETTPVSLTPDVSRKIKASGGFFCTKDTSVSIEELLAKADEALYKSKRNLKGQFTEYP